ncbi:AraC family transcriptional regulator [uncultured Pseudoteredinibacter sp.]|uniref:helix-turn-helix transcriptional regulator n=1 Tax=uncultured Pseudoteredinibacter sp. TaxID=1641701 RepID=UPI002624E34C|nr:AraC family transcriptional regulator [uncultured Pseudoteredinibacter sp.]
MQQHIRREISDAFASSKDASLQEMIRENTLEIEAEEFFPGGHITRYHVHNQALCGRQEIVQINRDFSVITSNIEATKASQTSYSGANWLALQLCVAGEYEVSINKQNPQILKAGDCRLDIFSKRGTLNRYQQGGSRYRNVALYMSIEAFKQNLNVGQHAEQMLQQLFQDDLIHPHASSTFEASKSLMISANELSEFGRFGGLRPAYIKAKAIEFMVYAANFARWQGRGVSGLRSRAKLSRSVNIAQQTKAIIDREYSIAHTIDELAQRIGTNRTTLSQSFRAEYQLTPMQYRRRLRLEVAKQMLQYHEGSVGEVAEHVGYADASCFIRAFRDYYGETPGS